MINDDECARRRWAVDQADAHQRIEGIETPPAVLAVFERWIVGEIDSDECTRQIRAISPKDLRLEIRTSETPDDLKELLFEAIDRPFEP
jgi:hypothetical protein